MIVVKPKVFLGLGKSFPVRRSVINTRNLGTTATRLDNSKVIKDIKDV